jgi:hypothetical protein
VLKEAWEEAGFLYLSSELCELGNLNYYISKNNSLIEEILSDTVESNSSLL